jgi:hypothetical protein
MVNASPVTPRRWPRSAAGPVDCVMTLPEAIALAFTADS